MNNNFSLTLAGTLDTTTGTEARSRSRRHRRLTVGPHMRVAGLHDSKNAVTFTN